MRPPLSLIALLAAVLVAGAAYAQALYSPPEADFSVAFPMPPTVVVRPAKRMSDVAVRRYVDQEASRAFVVTLEDYPQGDLPPSANGAVYDRIMRSHAEEVSTELVSTRAVRLAGRPSLEGTFRDSDGNVEILRVLMLPDRLIRLTYARAAGLEDPSGPEAFFASFKLASP